MPTGLLQNQMNMYRAQAKDCKLPGFSMIQHVADHCLFGAFCN